MQLQGKAISHVKFGNGIIKELKDKYLIVDFVHGERKFLFPNVFAGFLSLTDKEAQREMESMLADIITKKENVEKAELNEQERFIRIQKLKVHPNSQAAFGLIQNKKEDVFESWSVFSGEYLSGNSKGEPKQPIRLNLNSVCLLTECAQEGKEKERRIVGAFMVKDDFDGRACKDGYIEGHSTYRIRLDESEMLPFYKYFKSEAKVTGWGNTEFKYFSNDIMKEILKDMKNAVIDVENKKKANDFYQYYCYVNRLEDVQKTEVDKPELDRDELSSLVNSLMYNN